MQDVANGAKRPLYQRASGAPPLRILVCTTVESTVAAFLLPLIALMREQGWHVSVACRIETGSAAAFGADAAVHLPFSRRLFSLDNFHALLQIRRLLRREHYDLLHLHTPIASFLSRLATAGLGPGRPRVIYTAHGLHFQEGARGLSTLLYRGVECFVSRWTDAIVVMNDEDEAAAKRYRLGRRVVRIDGVGVDPEIFSPLRFDQNASERWRRVNGLPPRTPLITMIAEMNPGKRHRDALEAMLTVREAHPEAILLFVGDGRLRGVLEARAARAGLGGAVRFLGLRSDVPSILAATEIMILPSIREGLPRSILEAMSMEVPVIACDIRGSRDLLRDGVGRLITPRSPRELAGEIIRLLEHPEIRREMGAAGRARVLDRYCLPRILANYQVLMQGFARREQGGEREECQSV